jgi:two-component system chemotaxis response regulator CheB
MKILIVDDSALIRSILKAIFSETEGFTVAGEASNGAAGVEMAGRISPDLVLMDINMPVMNGLEATRAIMEKHPVPICIFSNEVDSDLTIKALGLGAVDVVRKPDIDKFNDKVFMEGFLAKLSTLTRAKMIMPKAGPFRGGAVKKAEYKAVVLGASTGGPVAVKEVLRSLPKTFPLGIALVQHIEDRFDKSYAAWLDTQTELSVRLARERDEFIPGTVLVAPGGRHLICREGKLCLEDGPKVANQRPAVDRLFETSGTWYGERLVGVLLTGMGADGAAGCVVIKSRGGHTVVQDEETSTIFGMPKAAIERGGASVVLPLQQIGEYLVKLVV